LAELQEFKLPAWPKSKIIEFSSDKSKKLDAINKCIEALCDVVEKNRSVASMLSIQSFFGRRPSADEPPASGVLYFAIASTKKVGASDLETQIRLELMPNGASHFLVDKIDSFSKSMTVRHKSLFISLFGANLTSFWRKAVP
jgi:hypothetical protein